VVAPPNAVFDGTIASERHDGVARLGVRPLEPAEAERFVTDWRRTEARFVDDPRGAVAEADGLVGELMQTRGDPVTDFEQRVGSSEHALTASYTRRPVT